MIPLNPLAKVIDYQSMLRRFFVFTTIAGCGAVWLLRFLTAVYRRSRGSRRTCGRGLLKAYRVKRFTAMTHLLAHANFEEDASELEDLNASPVPWSELQ